MNITIIGCGYVGLVTGACFAEMGNSVVCVDSNVQKVFELRRGIVPIHEPGLDALVARNAREGRLKFEATLRDAVAGTSMFFIAVGTPSAPDGSADTSAVLAAARELGRLIESDAVVACKSTAPVGTADEVQRLLNEELGIRDPEARVSVVSNPEFLKEGAAVNDFMRPDRVVIGSSDPAAVDAMRSLYSSIIRNHDRIIVMGRRDAEMTKYASNAMLATRISFMNEIASFCEFYGVDIENVRHGIGADSRIGYSYIYAGCGYGGSCFPKDIRAMIHMSKVAGQSAALLESVDARNDLQKRLLADKVIEHFGGDVRDKTIAVWGLAFKPETDDMRDAPSITFVSRLIAAGARIRAYDPVAMESARSMFPNDWISTGLLQFTEHQYHALEGADAVALLTEWRSFRQPDFRAMKRLMRRHAIFDGRNQYDPDQVAREGFAYFGIGRRPSLDAARTLAERAGTAAAFPHVAALSSVQEAIEKSRQFIGMMQSA